MRKQGAVPGMQLAHSGRKGSTAPPWLGGKKVPPEEGGWEPVAPSAEPFQQDYPMPRALKAIDIREIVDAFRRAAERAFAAGFEVFEIRAAGNHGLHEFLSLQTKPRPRDRGGMFTCRFRLPMEAASSMRLLR